MPARLESGSIITTIYRKLLSRMAWKLRIKDHNSGAVTENILDQPVAHIGRDPNGDVALKHKHVSRRHVELRAGDAGSMSVVDSSSNGTFVREDDKWVRIERSRELTLPFVLRIAHWTVKIEEGAAPEPSPAEDEQSWDQSVMIPVSSLEQRTESILVFDLCESSLIASKDDHMAYHLKQRLTHIAEPILAEFGCRFFKSTGDGFLTTFEDPDKALQAAVKVEDHIQYRNQRTSNMPIHYRIALHHGDVWAISAGGDDVHGNDVNITFRIEGVQSSAFPDIVTLFPKRDRILCSGAYHKAVGKNVDRLTSECLHCGAATLKGIAEPVGVYWLKTQHSIEDLYSALAIRTGPPS
jgi:class 3 adenylate cyclase